MKTINIFFLVIIWLAFLAIPTTVGAQRSEVQVWSQTCGNCHKSQPAGRYTARKWESIATHMKIHARLTDEETEIVLGFLKDGAKDVVSAVPAPNNVTEDSKAMTVASTDPDNSASGNYQLTKEEIKALKAFIQNSEKKDLKKEDLEKKNDKK